MENTTLVALTPDDMPAAQRGVATWLDAKLEELKTSAEDLRANLEVAVMHGWRTAGLERLLTISRRQVVYYNKLKAAVAAGFLIIPNMPCEAFAIRVKRLAPRAGESSNAWSRFLQNPDVLPEGEGRYVSPDPTTESFQKPLDHGKDGIQLATRYRPDEFTEIDFPVAIVKPVIMEKTARAMGLKLFDELAIVRNEQKNSDPFVIGAILGPRHKRTTFFVAWWLDTAVL